MFAALRHCKLSYAYELLCVELYTSRNTWVANQFGIRMFRVFLFVVTFALFVRCCFSVVVLPVNSWRMNRIYKHFSQVRISS